MAAVGAMLLALAAIVGAGFSFISGSNWLGLGLIVLSTVLEAFAFLWAGREEGAG
jgi:hypothetical protein